jgi:hypothetical protein
MTAATFLPNRLTGEAYQGDPGERIWTNDRYTAITRELAGGWTWLSIRRNDRAAGRDWRHFQRIKNDICGPEREALELYPAESRLVDTSNQYHLWVLPAGERLPFGYQEREVMDADDPELARIGARQRPLPKAAAWQS